MMDTLTRPHSLLHLLAPLLARIFILKHSIQQNEFVGVWALVFPADSAVCLL